MQPLVRQIASHKFGQRVSTLCQRLLQELVAYAVNSIGDWSLVKYTIHYRMLNLVNKCFHV